MLIYTHSVFSFDCRLVEYVHAFVPISDHQLQPVHSAKAFIFVCRASLLPLWSRIFSQLFLEMVKCSCFARCFTQHILCENPPWGRFTTADRAALPPAMFQRCTGHWSDKKSWSEEWKRCEEIRRDQKSFVLSQPLGNVARWTSMAWVP